MLTRRRVRDLKETNAMTATTQPRTMRSRIATIVPAWVFNMIFDFLSVLAQLGGVIATPWLLGVHDDARGVLVPVSVLLVSCGWWENYASCDRKKS
jgi:hypothetical protein